jgi:large subunit ribosomal protein L31
MKKNLHPECHNITIRCVCGNSFETTSTLNKIDTDICSACHPFFTGAQKFVDTAGRIEKFQRRYTTPAKSTSTKPNKKEAAAPALTSTPAVEVKEEKTTEATSAKETKAKTATKKTQKAK